MHKPLVSVVMATYNGAKFLAPQLDSILAQTYSNLEIIVVDDASKDATRDILADYQRRDSRICVIYAARNRGVVATFEEALRHANGEFIALSDQDDVFHVEKLARQVDCLLEHPAADIALSDLTLINEQGDVMAASMWEYQHLPVKAGKPFSQLLCSNFATGCAMMVRRRLLDVAIPFPPDCMVHDWWLSVLSASSRGGGIAIIPEALTYYRQHASNVIGASKGGVFAALRRVRTIEARCDACRKNVLRLEGYLARDIWSDADRKAIRALHELMQEMAADDRNGLPTRLASLRTRVHYALPFGWFRILGMIAHALCPRCLDNSSGN
ncbi:MAG TPA: glycosyltransferase family 2 protein [Gallionellaceae bacterium]|nr:glycosyltransferase family 2 protein [Gallionellaceae bacterium]